jgi:hypothetical protein
LRSLRLSKLKSFTKSGFLLKQERTLPDLTFEFDRPARMESLVLLIGLLWLEKTALVCRIHAPCSSVLRDSGDFRFEESETYLEKMNPKKMTF